MGYNASLSGAVSNNELVSIEVDPPVLSDAVEAQALSASREKELTITDDRRMLMEACAVEVERYCDRMFWPGLRMFGSHVYGGHHRAFTFVLCRLLPALP